MIIGTFTYDAKADLYQGEIKTLSLHRPGVVFRPQTRGSDREPDYRVSGTTSEGEVEFGAAWSRRSDQGKEYLSVLLDDPALGAPLSAALFTDPQGAANLVWSRPSARSPRASTAAAPSAGRSKPSARTPAAG